MKLKRWQTKEKIAKVLFIKNNKVLSLVFSFLILLQKEILCYTRNRIGGVFMGKFDEYVQKTIQKENISFESSQELQEELTQAQKLLTEVDMKTQEDQKTILINQVNTTIGLLNQLTIQIHHPYLNSVIEQITTQEKDFLEQLDATRNIQDETTLLETLESLGKKVSDFYIQSKEKMLTTVQKGVETLKEREELLNEIEKMIQTLDSFSNLSQIKQSEDVLEPLASLYIKANQEDITTLQGLENEVALLKEWRENAIPILDTLKQQPQVAHQEPSKEKNFSLFDKRNDQIIGYLSTVEDGKRYVKYLLEDGSYYFAVVEGKEQVDYAYQQFYQNASLLEEQNKEAWCKNLEIILSCLQVYYQLDEFVRYEEVSNKGKMISSKEEVIHTYQKMLSFMEENVIRQYLDYADALSKQVLIGDNEVNTFYKEMDSLEEGPKKAKEQLIVTVLGNKEAKKEVTSKQILETLYSVDLESMLAKMEQEALIPNEEILEPTPVSQTPVVPQVTIPNIPATNYDQMSSYFEERFDSWKEVLPENELSFHPKRKEDAIYKEINQYLDLEEAKQITNSVYAMQNQGQGDYAKMVFLQEGRLEGFTSKYQARQLASFVDRNQYFYLMLTQAVKDYATFNEQRKRNPQFGEGIENMFSLVGQAVLEESFDLNTLISHFLTDDAMLAAISKNFDGRYLIPGKGDSPLFETVLKDYQKGNPMFAAKVESALTTLRDQLKMETYQVPTKSEIKEMQSSQKVA